MTQISCPPARSHANRRLPALLDKSETAGHSRLVTPVEVVYEILELERKRGDRVHCSRSMSERGWISRGSILIKRVTPDPILYLLYRDSYRHVLGDVADCFLTLENNPRSCFGADHIVLAVDSECTL